MSDALNGRMPRRRRNFNPDSLYFITSRTFQRRYLMKPTPEVRDTIGALLARAIRRYDVRLYGYVFMSNHFHLIVQGTPTSIPRCIGWLKREISVHIGHRLWGWTGGFWEKRYEAAKIVDRAELEAKLQYIASHGVKEGLVARPEDWPGLHCIHQLGTDAPLFFAFPGKGRNASGRVERLTLDPLPHWEKAGVEHRKRCQLVFMRRLEVATKKLLLDRKPSGLAKLREKPHDFRPKQTKSEPAPLCHSSTAAGRQDYLREFKEHMRSYDLASAAFRAGDLTVEFPPGAFRPSLPPFK